MVKHVLVCALCVCVVASTGCAELKKLRSENANLQRQLEEAQRSLETYKQSQQALEAQNQALRASLTQGQAETAQMAAIIADLKKEQEARDAEKARLKKLVDQLAGFNFVERDEGNFISMESDILFESGRAELTEASKQSLDKLVGYLKEQSALKIRIDGHTDGVPIKVSGWKDNYHLAAMRAHAVMVHLLGKGIPAGRMYIAGFGPNRPMVEPSRPEEPMEQNRRVEIFLVPADGGSIREILEGIS
jgi:chemotaxis protein MotB